MKNWRKNLALCLSAIMLAAFSSCGAANGTGSTPGAQAAEPAVKAESGQASEDGQATGQDTDAPESGQTAEHAQESAPASTEPENTEKNGDIVILYTSDIHCGVDQGFGFVGLQQIRDSLEKKGFTTILVDNGDAIQGEVMGTVTNGAAMIELMNAMKYDIAIPGNHEFDYSTERFLELAKQADFPYISCNFNKEGELVFPPYIIKEAAGKRIAFVGVTTPVTVTASTPKYFQDKDGNYVYDFKQDVTGEELYEAVQKAVDDARAEGVDYVYVMGHIGMEESTSPWTYVDVISHTNGIDVFLDGHSHDTEQVIMKNKDGEDVVRTACGTKMQAIGYSMISAEDGVTTTNIWKWTNKDAVPDILDIHNEMNGPLNDVMLRIAEQTEKPIAISDVDLTIFDPEVKDSSGNPIRVIRRAETNLGDFVTDAIRIQTETDIAVCGGGAIRSSVDKGEISYGDILSVFPFQNQIAVIRATGQQIVDALEWGASGVPGEFGGFLHVSGLSYEIDASVPSGCIENEDGMMAGIEGERRVRNVLVNGEPIDPEKTYTVSGNDYALLNNGDGQTAFDGAEVVNDQFKLDSQLLIDYIMEDLNGEIGEEYADPYGQERIVITE